MSTNYPGTIQTFVNPVGTNTLDSPDHAGLHSDLADTSEALQVKLGVGAGSPTLNTVLVGSGNGTATWGGTINALTLGTPIVDNFTSSGTSTPSKADRGLAPTVVTLSDSAGGTITPNAAAGQVFSLELGTTAGNRTLAVPNNPTEGQAINYRIKQNTGNTGTIVFATGYKMNDGGTPTLGTQSTWNYVGFRYYSGGTAWHHQGNSLGII
jgi:hypothetical protein